MQDNRGGRGGELRYGGHLLRDAPFLVCVFGLVFLSSFFRYTYTFSPRGTVDQARPGCVEMRGLETNPCAVFFFFFKQDGLTPLPPFYGSSQFFNPRQPAERTESRRVDRPPYTGISGAPIWSTPLRRDRMPCMCEKCFVEARCLLLLGQSYYVIA